MTRRPLEALTFNGWVGQGEDGNAHLGDLLDDADRPAVVALQEVPWLDRRVHPYLIHRDTEGPREDRNNALLIRRDLTVHRLGLLRMDHAPWVGPKHGRTHRPRVLPWAEVSLPGERWRWCLLDVHRITSTNGRNDTQRAAEATQLADWLTAHRRRHHRRPIAALGDFNGRPVDLAARVGGRLDLAGIDGALTIGATARLAEMRGRYGSDSHQPVRVTLTAA